MALSYWEAWGRWWEGNSLGGVRLWGMPMLWWGRIGKLVQFVGGLAAIIDIIGPDRIAEWGRQLRERSIHQERKTLAQSWRRRWPTFEEVRKHELTTLVQLRASGGHGPWSGADPGDELFYTMYPEARPDYDEPRRAKRLSEDARQAAALTHWTMLALIVGVLVGVAVVQWWRPAFLPTDLPWWAAVLLIPAGAALGLLVELLFLFLVAAVPVLVVLVRRAWPILAYYLLVKPAVFVLRGPQPDRSLRGVGVLLVVIGFSFDLLAT